MNTSPIAQAITPAVRAVAAHIARTTADGKPIFSNFGDMHPYDPLVLVARGKLTMGEAIGMRGMTTIAQREYLKRVGIL